jgi:hypothetical protein
VECEIRVGKAASAGMAAARRWGTGGWIGMLAAVAMGFVACIVVNFLVLFIAGLTHLPRAAIPVLQLVFAMALLVMVGVPTYRRVVNMRYRRRLRSRGTSSLLKVAYEITDSAFVYTVGGITKTVRWDVVSEVFRAKTWWVLMAQGESYYLPSRAFAAQQEERVFISSVLDQMDASARDRSKDASTFMARTI